MVPRKNRTLFIKESVYLTVKLADQVVGIDRLGATMDGTSRKAVREAHRQGLIVSLWPGQSIADAMLGVYLEADFLCTDIPVEVKTFMDKQAPWIPAVY